MIKCEVYSRVSGYYRPVSQWNVGKKEEMLERKFISTADLKYKLQEVKNDRLDITRISSDC